MITIESRQAGPYGMRCRPSRHALYVRGLVGMFRAGARSVLVYRFDTMVGFVGIVIQVSLTVAVWRIVYRGHDLVAGIDRSTAIAYAALAACLQYVVTPWQFSSIPMRIRLGQIGVDLSRPQGLIFLSLSQTVGTMAARAPIGAAGILTAASFGGLQPPSSPGLAVLWMLSIAFGVGNILLCNLAMSMLAFWTMDVSGPFMVYRFGAAFCSGGLIPLWFMPDWLQRVLGWLPFQAQMFTPLTIWFGTVDAAPAALALGLQALWIMILAVVVRLIWARAVHRVVVLGG